MSDAPQTDHDMLYRWEWFRRSQWMGEYKRHIKSRGAIRAFAEVMKLADAQVALEVGSGLGQNAICLADAGVNIVGCESSGVGVEHAKELAASENSQVTFFQTPLEGIAAHAPHRFDAVYAENICLIPDWEKLVKTVGLILDTLNHGGFLMFKGAAEGTGPDIIKDQQARELELSPRESLEWRFKDGKSSCTKVRQKLKADDYIDDNFLFIIEDGEASRVESTAMRRPAYWSWDLWNEIMRGAGFCHLETRIFEGYGEGGADVTMNVAWKSKEGKLDIDYAGREAPYKD